MTENSLPIAPKKILVASDLSAGSDRAMDRGIQLATAWGAALTVLHVLDKKSPWPEYDREPSWQRSSYGLARIERDLRADLGSMAAAKVRILEGEPTAVIRDVAEEEHSDLIVVGEGRPWGLGAPSKTLDVLFRSAPVSTLVVKQRPRREYGKILVGTDFTDEALVALEHAGGLFPSASLALLHSFEVPYRSLVSDNQLSRDFGAMEKETIRGFIAQAALPETVKAGIATFVEHGHPADMLGRYADDHDIDLTVIGAYERSRLFHYLVGGQGPRILEAVRSDVLVVRPGLAN